MKKKQWVLLRGLAREQGHWEKFKNMFQEQFPDCDVTGVDLPGNGEFYKLSSPVSIEGLAEFVASQLHKGPQPQERYIMAISLGGMVAVELARLYPQEFNGMVLINSSFKNLSPVHHRLQLEALPHLYRGFQSTSMEQRESEVLDMVSNIPDKSLVIKEWAELAKKRPTSPVNFFKQLLAASLYDLPDQKPPFPVVVLTSYGDRMVDPRCSQRLSEHWKTPLEVHNSAGHEMCLDEPQWVLDKIKAHFK